MQSASAVITPAEPPYRFKGKVIVLVGKPTFSSAMMFATLVKDNKMAPLAGEIPEHAHPTKFGRSIPSTCRTRGWSYDLGLRNGYAPGRDP